MRRREFIAILGGAAAWPIVAQAQKLTKLPRIGYLGYSAPGLEQHMLNAFRKGLREIGYLEGKNIAIEYRVEGKLERLPELAAQLVALDVDVIVTLATPGALAAKNATNTIPIVVAAMADPARDGLVTTLARPGGNVTGSTFLGPELIPKRLGLLKQIVPDAARVSVLWHPGVYSEQTMKEMVSETEEAALAMGIELQFLAAQSASDFDGAFSGRSRHDAEALLVFPSPMLYLEHKRIVDLATKNRLPAMYPWREAVAAGGLIAYGANIPDLMLRAAVQVDEILKGAKPGELPIEQPTKFELVISLRAAKALGLLISRDFLLTADEVIE